MASLFIAVAVEVVARLADPRKPAASDPLVVSVIVALTADIKIFFLVFGLEAAEPVALAAMPAPRFAFCERMSVTARDGVADHPALGAALTAAMTAVGMVGAVNLLAAVAEIPALKVTPNRMGK